MAGNASLCKSTVKFCNVICRCYVKFAIEEYTFFMDNVHVSKLEDVIAEIEITHIWQLIPMAPITLLIPCKVDWNHLLYVARTSVNHLTQKQVQKRKTKILVETKSNLQTKKLYHKRNGGYIPNPSADTRLLFHGSCYPNCSSERQSHPKTILANTKDEISHASRKNNFCVNKNLSM